MEQCLNAMLPVDSVYAPLTPFITVWAHSMAQYSSCICVAFFWELVNIDMPLYTPTGLLVSSTVKMILSACVPLAISVP